MAEGIRETSVSASRVASTRSRHGGQAGALVSTSLVYTLPSLMFGQLLAAKAKTGLSTRERVELYGARFLTVLGLALAGIGMKAAF